MEGIFIVFLTTWTEFEGFIFHRGFTVASITQRKLVMNEFEVLTATRGW
jgi:hypothetical protein